MDIEYHSYDSIEQTQQYDGMWTPVPGTYDVRLDIVGLAKSGWLLVAIGQEFRVLSGEHRGRRFSRFPDLEPLFIGFGFAVPNQLKHRSRQTVLKLARVISGSQPESYGDALITITRGAREGVCLKVRITRLKSGNLSVDILRRLKEGEPGKREPQTGPTLPADRSVT